MTELTDFTVTLKMARKTGSLADEVEHRTFTVTGPAADTSKAEEIAYGLGQGINEATDHAWKFCGGSDGITVTPASSTDEVEQLRAELNEALPQITAAWTALNKAGFQSPVAGIAELIDELAAALADAEGRGTALAALLTKSREQAAKVHEQNAAAQNALRSLGQAYADLKTDNDELAAENARLKPVAEAAKAVYRADAGSRAALTTAVESLPIDPQGTGWTQGDNLHGEAEAVAR